MKIKESNVLSHDADTGALAFKIDDPKTAPKVGDVVDYQGRGYRVTERGAMNADAGSVVGTIAAKAEILRVEELGGVKPFALSLVPGDVVVLQAEKPMDYDRLREIQARANEAFPGFRFIVLDHEIKFAGTLRSEAV